MPPANMSRRNKSKSRSRRRQTEPIPRDEPLDSASNGQSFAERTQLQVLVFLAGAVLMGLEIAGSRVLAPHFGNSVFVWGSLISIFLIALSIGYYFGGGLADDYPSRTLLNSICIGVSLWIFAIAILGHSVCNVVVGFGAGEQTGPLLASIILFLTPSIGMGMVSPFAVRLATHSVHSVGKSAGTLYALSTMGSIAGTMLTTFVLVPLIGLMAIIKGLGLTLLLVSILTLPFWKSRRGVGGFAGLVVIALACLFWSGPNQSEARTGDTTLVDVDTPYHRISVIDNTIHGSRELRFDRYTESAISKTKPYPTLAGYTNYFHLALLAQPNTQRTAFIGAGGGVGPRAFHMHNPDMAIDVVDIDPKVLEIAEDYFFLDASPNIKMIAADGRMFMRQAEHTYDCVVLDAFTIGGRIPFHLVTREFLQLCSNKMTDGGVFVMNINSALDGPSAKIFESTYRTFEVVFPNTYVFALGHKSRGTSKSTNIILLATKDARQISPKEWLARAHRHESQSYVKRKTVEQMVNDLLVKAPDVSGAPVFTDDFAPIESMSF